MTLSRLPQAEITENEEHHYSKANKVDDVVHVTCSFLSRDWITGAPDPIPFPRDRPRKRTGRAEALLHLVLGLRADIAVFLL